MAALTIAAAEQLLTRRRAAAAVAAVLVITAAEVVTPHLTRRLRWALVEIGKRLGGTIGGAVGLITITPLLWIGWGIARLGGAPPVEQRSRRRPVVSSGDADIGRQLLPRRSPLRTKRFRLLSGLVLAGILLGAVTVVRGGPESTPSASTTAGGPRRLGISFDAPPKLSAFEAFADAAWADELGAETVEAEDGVRFDPVGLYLLADRKGRFINIDDGLRSTMKATCACPHRRVWMFGGSTTFGYGQRDDHTIASSLVAIAERNGIALDVVNFGVPGYGVWQEFLRFEDGLARADVPPDLVVFLDGHNDLLIQYQIDARGGDPTRPATQVDDRLQELIARKPPTTDTSSPATPETIGQQTMDRWERTWRLITELSVVHDTAAIAFWQPMLVTKVPRTGAEEGLIKPSDAENLGRSARSARTEIPEGVIDLSDSLNRDETLFYDSVHTNERGAALVAEAMWPAIQRQLATR